MICSKGKKITIRKKKKKSRAGEQSTEVPELNKLQRIPFSKQQLRLNTHSLR